MLKTTAREAAAEFLGTFVLIAFGAGVGGAGVLSGGSHGGYLRSTGLGLAVTWPCTWPAVSGAHLNPAVTLAAAVHRGFAWSKVPAYVAAQIAGAFTASAVVSPPTARPSTCVRRGRRQVAGPQGTAGIFATYPQPFLSAVPGGLLDQVVGTALLIVLIFALTDGRNLAPDPRLAPVAFGLAVTVIGMAFGLNAGYAINPARDLGPRLFTAVAGWGAEVFRAGGHWWWVPIVGPLVGAVLGGWVYDVFITAPASARTAAHGRPLKPTSSPSTRAKPPAAPSCSAVKPREGHRQRSSRRSARVPARWSTTPRPSGPRSSGWPAGADRLPCGAHGHRGHRDHEHGRPPSSVTATPAAVANAIVWQSRVTAPRCEQLQARRPGAAFRERTGLVMDAYFSGTKVAHLLDNRTGGARAAKRATCSRDRCDSFLMWRLQRRQAPRHRSSNASRTLLSTHPHPGLGRRAAAHPEGAAADAAPGAASTSVYGEADPTLFRRAHPIAERPRPAGATFDRPASTPARQTPTATGCFMLLNTARSPCPEKRLLTTIGWQIGREVTYCLEARCSWRARSCRVAARTACRHHRLRGSELPGREVPERAGLLRAPAFVGLGAPYFGILRARAVSGSRGAAPSATSRAGRGDMAYQTRTCSTPCSATRPSTWPSSRSTAARP